MRINALFFLILFCTSPLLSQELKNQDKYDLYSALVEECPKKINDDIILESISLGYTYDYHTYSYSYKLIGTESGLDYLSNIASDLEDRILSEVNENSELRKIYFNGKVRLEHVIIDSHENPIVRISIPELTHARDNSNQQTIPERIIELPRKMHNDAYHYSYILPLNWDVIPYDEIEPFNNVLNQKYIGGYYCKSNIGYFQGPYIVISELDFEELISKEDAMYFFDGVIRGSYETYDMNKILKYPNDVSAQSLELNNVIIDRVNTKLYLMSDDVARWKESSIEKKTISMFYPYKTGSLNFGGSMMKYKSEKHYKIIMDILKSIEYDNSYKPI